MNDCSHTLKQQYQNRFNSNKEYRNQVWRILCENFFSQYITPADTLLDLGAGWGEFIRNMRAQEKYALDLNPECGTLVHGFANFIHQDCTMPWPFLDGSLDVVFSSNFLEHLSSKQAIDTILKEAHRCLKKNGRIILLGPNIRFIPSTYWDYWDHHIPISDKSMVEALTLQEFNIIKVIDRFLPYTMSNIKNPPLCLIKLYLKIPFLWSILGKQFLVIARKP